EGTGWSLPRRELTGTSGASHRLQQPVTGADVAVGVEVHLPRRHRTFLLGELLEHRQVATVQFLEGLRDSVPGSGADLLHGGEGRQLCLSGRHGTQLADSLPVTSV